MVGVDNGNSVEDQKVCTRRARDAILSLHDDNGNSVEDPEALKNLILDYYTGLWVRLILVEWRLLTICSVLFLLGSLFLLGEEIKKVLWTVSGDKAPGPDG